jgi:hypothetical protein
MYWHKPTLQKLRRHHKIPVRALALLAGVPQRVVYLAEIGAVVSRDEAARILHAISHLLGRPVTFHEVYINVRWADQETQPLPIARLRRMERWKQAARVQGAGEHGEQTA